MTLEARFWVKVKTGGPDDCWEWLAASLPRGHGVFGAGPGRNVLAHRFSYELRRGPIADGHVIHHVCENPRCVNPQHLAAMTQAEHLRLHQRPLKTVCAAGHPYDGDNLYVNPRGQRFCRICQREAKRRYKARQRSARLDPFAVAEREPPRRAA